MDANEVLVKVGDAELIFLAAGGLAFLVLYSLFTKWWRWREGRFIFMAALWLTLLFSYFFAARMNWLGDLENRAWIRVVILTGFGVALLWAGALLIMAQLERRQDDAAERRP